MILRQQHGLISAAEKKAAEQQKSDSYDKNATTKELENLAVLKARDLLTDTEFTDKKMGISRAS
jgi:hypothetical protein